MPQFFDRLQQLIDYKGIKSVNEFALKYLNYTAPQKINRLKGRGRNPSYEIILDIVNKFEDLNAEWLLTGRGSMINEVAYDQTTDVLKMLVQAQDKTIKLLEEKLLEAERKKSESAMLFDAGTEPHQILTTIKQTDQR